MEATAIRTDNARPLATATSPLARAFSTLLKVLPEFDRLGDGSDVIRDAALLGIDIAQVAAADVMLGRRSVSLLCISSRLWNSPDEMEVVFHLKRELYREGRDVLLVPEQFVRRQPRLENAAFLAGMPDVRITGTERLSILAYLGLYEAVPLSELAALISGDDPVSGILKLVVDGALEMNLDETILHSSMVRLARARS